MKKNHILIIITIAVLGIVGACKEDFLNITPSGALDASVLGNEKGIDALLIGAYSMLDGISNWDHGAWASAQSNWVWGDIRGMIANKGTDSGDQPDINALQSFSENASNPYLDNQWRAFYEGVSRSNNVITVATKALADGKITQDQADLFIMQAKALRGWYHFGAWRMWQDVPYIDEKVNPAEVTNSVDIRANIVADLQAGTGLPNNMGQIGRWNKTVCQVQLAKALMQMNGDYATAKTLLQEVKTSGTNPKGEAIGLYEKYGDIFMIENRNCKEAVYTIQYSVNDGGEGYNAGYGEILNFPYKSGGSPGGCCGFYQPTQEYVNSFRTSGGLPLLNHNYNLDPVISDQGAPVKNDWIASKTYDSIPVPLATDKPGAVVIITDPSEPAHRQVKAYMSLIFMNVGNPPLTSPAAWKLLWEEDPGELDPRLDWSVGRRGIPYFDWGIMTGSDWIRDQTYAGPYVGKKQVYKKSQEGTLTDVTSWTSGLTANGYRLIRFADVLLLLAECQIETNDLTGALTNINLVRARAANSDGWVKEDDGVTNAANYVISQYPTGGVYPFDSQANARIALYMERKLELGMEGHRWFDLNRWGITKAELTKVLAYEKTTAWGGGAMYNNGTATVDDVDLWFPIPQRQIDLMGGKLVQNR